MSYSQFNIYRSSDLDAPVLTGESGSLINVLTSCLVTGYGTKESAGWVLAYTSSDSNGAAYKMPSGSGFYLSVDDRAKGPGSVKEARISGYEMLTSWDTGSRKFPNSTVTLKIRKSDAVSTIKNIWSIFADEYTMYMFILTPQSPSWKAWTFGDIYSYGDVKNPGKCLVIGSEFENTASESFDRVSGLGYNVPGHFMNRNWSGTVPEPVRVGKFGNLSYGYTTTLNGALNSFNGSDSGIYLSPITVHSNNTDQLNQICGKMRGIWQINNLYYMFVCGQQFSGMGESIGRKFEVIVPGYHNGIWAMETSATIETN